MPSAAFGPLARVLTGQALSSLSAFATVLVLGRWGGEANLGQYALGWSCWFVALSLGDTLVATPFTYYRAQERLHEADLTMAGAWGTLVLAALFVVGLTAASGTGLTGLATQWPALPAAIAASLMREYRRRHLLATGQVTALLKLDAASALAQTTGLAWLVAAQAVTAVAVLWLTAASSTLLLLPLLTAPRLKRLCAAANHCARTLRMYFDYGRWLVFGGMCHVLGVQAYPWLAFASGGARDVGLLAACTTILSALSPLLTGLTNHYRPRFMQTRRQLSPPAFTAYTLRKLPVFVLPALLLSLLLLAMGSGLLTRLYGPAYAEAAPALAWLALGTTAVSFAAPLQLALLARGAPLSNLVYHGSAVLALSLAVLLTGPSSLTDLARINGLVNLAATAVLAALLFRLRPALRPIAHE